MACLQISGLQEEMRLCGCCSPGVLECKCVACRGRRLRILLLLDDVQPEMVFRAGRADIMRAALEPRDLAERIACDTEAIVAGEPVRLLLVPKYKPRVDNDG
jgi:hypothetical protein